MIVGFQWMDANDNVKTASVLNIPNNCDRVLIQCGHATVHMRYTMDGTTNPTTAHGMILRTTDPPLEVLVADLRNIRFCRDGGSGASEISIHYFGPDAP